MKFLKTNNAVRIAVGPFLDYSDGVTPLTGITVTNTTCELYKEADDGNGVTRVALTLSASGGDNDMVHITSDVAGYYDLELTASNVNFLGRMTLVFTDPDVHLPVFMEFMVVPAMVYNSLVAGSDYLETDVTQWKGATAPAMTGDAYARLGAPTGASIAADLQVVDGVADSILEDTAEIGAAGAGLTAIKDKTDLIPESPAAVGSAMTLTGAYDAAKNSAPESGGNIAAIKAKTDYLPSAAYLDATISSRSTLTAQQVWEYATRTLTTFGTLVSDMATAVWAAVTRSLTDKAGFTISGTKQTLDALEDLSQAGAQAGATAALNAYDPPTKAEMIEALGALNDITVADILAGNMADDQSFATNSLGDRLRKACWMILNKMMVVDVSGNYTLYKSDGVTPAATGSITDDETETVRSAPEWL